MNESGSGRLCASEAGGGVGRNIMKWRFFINDMGQTSEVHRG